MLFAIDVGNTNVTIGLFDKEKLLNTFRMTTGIARTSDEYGLFLSDWLAIKKFPANSIDAVIISSVVPKVMHSLINGIVKYFHINPIIVAPGIKTGINITIPNPKVLGADRLVDAVGAFELYGGPVLVIDFGTATTHDLVLKNGSFHSGVTSPGIRMTASALSTGTAKLPEFEIKKPDTVLAKDTVTSMQAGIFYGYIGQTEYIIDKIKEESKLDDIKVVATGGLGKLISENTKKIDIYDPHLTLQGLRLIYEKQ